jgi:predicted Zn-dependent protease
MRGRTTRWAGAGFLLLVAVALARCATNPVTGETELMLVSEQEEIALGRRAYPALRWQDGGPLLADAATQRYLAEITARLHAVSHRPGLPVDFLLHSASEPNAWAIPGHTAMHRGLLQALDSEAQFAFVMGHEMGHVAARHSAKRQTYGLVGEALLSVGAAALGDGGLLPQLALGAASLGTGLVLLRYDRAQELEADRLGVLYMARAGYAPSEAIAAHRTLQQAVDGYLANLGKSRENPGLLGEFLSTHPRHEVRVAELERFIQELSPVEVRTREDGRFADRWRRETAAVRALAPAYARYDRARLALRERRLEAAEREIEGALGLADQAQFWALRGAVLARRGRPAEARQAYQRALALYPGYQPAVHGVGALKIAEGQEPEGMADLRESLRLWPDNAPSAYLLGVALARRGQPGEAVPLLRAVAESSPRDPAIHGLLAQQYERLGDERAALAAWQAQLRVAPASDLGTEARRRVSVLAARATEPLVSSSTRVRLVRPLSWEVRGDRSIERGGELVLRRADPEATFRVTYTSYGGRQDASARLDQWVEDRLRGGRVTGREQGFPLGNRTGVVRYVERRGVEYLVAATAREGRVWWVEVSAPAAAWRDPAVRGEIQRLLDSLEF